MVWEGRGWNRVVRQRECVGRASVGGTTVCAEIIPYSRLAYRKWVRRGRRRGSGSGKLVMCGRLTRGVWLSSAGGIGGKGKGKGNRVRNVAWSLFWKGGGMVSRFLLFSGFRVRIRCQRRFTRLPFLLVHFGHCNSWGLKTLHSTIILAYSTTIIYISNSAVIRLNRNISRWSGMLRIYPKILSTRLTEYIFHHVIWSSFKCLIYTLLLLFSESEGYCVIETALTATFWLRGQLLPPYCPLCPDSQTIFLPQSPSIRIERS